MLYVQTLEERYRMQCLRCLMHRYLYYVKGTPVLLDSEYDELEDEVRSIEEAHPEMIHPGSPTQTAGSDIADTYPPMVRRNAEALLRDRG